ncbi:hypothetical protein [Bradyrhizobium sp. RDT46]|uniref:hypothetical protein n=1 Tax=Bradyrhizobium sp. RDT46 TaxID=3341829 RepID=UPI0035C6ED15
MFEKKTAPASESLARNLAANGANGEETVHAEHMGHQAPLRQESRDSRRFVARKARPL